MTNASTSLTRRLFPLALGVSLSFNAAVVVGFMAGGGAGRPGAGPAPGPDHAAPPHGPRAPLGPGLDLDRAARLLQLTDEQRSKLEELKGTRDRIFPALDEAAQLLEEDLRAELSKESADSAKVREILDRQAQLAIERRTAQADLFEQFNQVLTPEQRRTLHEQRLQRPRPQHPPEVVRRFDRDNDGRLNETEREAAEAELFARRQMDSRPGMKGRPDAMRGDGAPPLWAFFDRDEDGQLNETERAERDEFVRTHRPSRAWRGEGRREGPRDGGRDGSHDGPREGPRDGRLDGPLDERPGGGPDGRPPRRPEGGRPNEPRPETDEDASGHRPPERRLR